MGSPSLDSTPSQGTSQGAALKRKGEKKKVQTSMFKINKLQGDTVQHREDSQYFGITINEFINFFFFWVSLGLNSWHTEVPRRGVESEL